jgi:hypothetical protein
MISKIIKFLFRKIVKKTILKKKSLSEKFTSIIGQILKVFQDQGLMKRIQET